MKSGETNTVNWNGKIGAIFEHKADLCQQFYVI